MEYIYVVWPQMPMMCTKRAWAHVQAICSASKRSKPKAGACLSPAPNPLPDNPERFSGSLIVANSLRSTMRKAGAEQDPYVRDLACMTKF